MKYLKITSKYNLTVIAKVSDDYEIENNCKGYYNETRIFGAIESIGYDEDVIKIYHRNVIYLQEKTLDSDSIKEISCKEYNNIVRKLKERRITYHNDLPKEPYMIDVEHSTNDCIKVIPKPGFEVGRVEAYHWEYFETMGAAYPMSHYHYFENKPYEIKIDKDRYHGYKFVPEESTFEKSVYKIVWPTKKDFEKTELIWR